jgi:dipeptidyl aminopeptidase/acylaminoacyl peptidase
MLLNWNGGSMDRDLRQGAVYQQMEAHFLAALAPAFGLISGAADLAPSPDGRAIAFTGSRMQRLEGVPETRICVAALPSGPIETITSGPHDDRMPRWSPDGTRLAFLSDRRQRGMHQLHLLARARLGEALTTPWIEGMAEYLAWSPDGATILVGVAGPGADIGDALGAGTTATRAEDLPSWMPAVDSGISENKWRRLWLYEPSTGRSRVLSAPDLNIWEAAWAGTGHIVAVASRAPGEGAWYTAQLVRIDVRSGHAEVVYRSPRQLGVPAASPSGDWVAIIQALCSDRGMVAGDLLLFARDGGAPRMVDTGGVDVTHLAWRDERHLFFAGLRGLQTVFGEVDMASAAARVLWSTDESAGEIFPHAAPLADGAFAVVLESYHRYPEFMVVRDGVPASVASFAHAGSEYLVRVGGTLEPARWTAPDGLQIEGLLARPAGPGPYPLVVNIHGGPVWSYRNCWAQYQELTRALVSRGYAVLHPNPRGSTGRGQAFAEEVYGDMGGADAEDILSGVEALVASGLADTRRLGTMGVSYGGFMTSLLITRTERFAAAISMSPVNEWRSMHYTTYFPDFDRLFLQDEPSHVGGQYEARSPLLFAGHVRTPTLHTTGALDEATPATQAVAFHHALLEHGVPSVLVVYPEEGHSVRRYPAIIDRCARVVAWLERFMPT